MGCSRWRPWAALEGRSPGLLKVEALYCSSRWRPWVALEGRGPGLLLKVEPCIAPQGGGHGFLLKVEAMDCSSSWMPSVVQGGGPQLFKVEALGRSSRWRPSVVQDRGPGLLFKVETLKCSRLKPRGPLCRDSTSCFLSIRDGDALKNRRVSYRRQCDCHSNIRATMARLLKWAVL